MVIEGIEITHPEKVLYPKKNITKGQVAEYYSQVASKMLPYLKNRPLTLHRFPSGIDKKGFYQKNVSDYFPDFIERVEIETEEGVNIQMVCDNIETLLYLVNQNTIGFHTWLSRTDKLRQPDKVVFDLDPPEGSFKQVKEAALILRDFFEAKKKEPQLMTTGQSGLHIYYKKRRGKDFDQVKEEVRTMAEELVSAHPNRFTTNIRKDQREGKIFLDFLRNAYAQTSVCPYSLRPNEVAGIATPLSWDQLEEIKTAQDFSLES